MSRYEFWISGENCGTIEADSIDDAVRLFTDRKMIGYDGFASLGAWLEEMHRLNAKENHFEPCEVTNLDTGMSIALEHADVDDIDD